VPPDDDEADVEDVPDAGDPDVDSEGHMAPPRDEDADG
jgi:hypothetical protein